METDATFTGSWVALPTPMDDNYSVDLDGFRRLIDFHAAHGTCAVLIGGSAGEVSTLSANERRAIVDAIAPYAADKIPAYFSASMPTTAETVDLAMYSEAAGAAGLILTVPAYSLPPQSAAADYLTSAAQAVSIPTGVYNNPSRVYVNIDPETIAAIHKDAPNFIFDKEASPDASQGQRVARLTSGGVSIFTCDNPRYGLLPTALTFGKGAANITGNIAPNLMAELSKPFTADTDFDEWRQLFYRAQPLIEMCYSLINPMAIKAALAYLGFPAGPTRLPLGPVRGSKLANIKKVIDDYGYALKSASY